MISSHSVEIKWKNTSTRTTKDMVVRIVGYAILAFLLYMLGSIIEWVSGGAISHITWQIIVSGNTFEPGGGIANAIIGTWLLVGMGLLLSVPVGLLGSLYLINPRTNQKLSSTLRLFTDMLTSVPSIVIGLFGYLVLVIEFKWGFSLLAGGFALAVMMLPYVLRVSELSMKAVPQEQVQNAYALGADSVQVASKIYLPQAVAGIMSGVILSVSIASGETAQLLYTAEWNTALPLGILHSSVGYLTYVVYWGWNLGLSSTIQLGFIAAFVLIVMLLGLTVLSKYTDRIVRALSALWRGNPDAKPKVKLEKVGKKK